MSAPSQKRVLVTGASGFIGRHALPFLLEHGYEVHVVGTRELPTDLRERDRVRFHSGDLLLEADRGRVMKEASPTHLLHLAWFTTHGAFWGSLENLKWVSASLDLLEKFAIAGGKRSVFAGTCAEYLWDGRPAREDCPREPATLYGVCKNSLQQIYAKSAETFGVSAAWGRIFLIYGPHEGAKRLVPTAIQQLLQGNAAEFTHGKQLRDFIYVSDLARAFVDLLGSPFVGPMNLASGQGVELRQVVTKVGELMGRPDLIRLGVRAAPAGEPDSLVADTSLMKEVLGFVPEYDLESGLRGTVEWWSSWGSVARSRA